MSVYKQWSEVNQQAVNLEMNCLADFYRGVKQAINSVVFNAKRV